MLPFVRMLEYGNITIVNSIKRIEMGLSSSFPNMVLLSSGDAYIGGFNDSGQLGDGTKINKFRQMLKINATGIQHISCSAYSSMYVSFDNKIYLSGDRSIQNASGSLSAYTSYTDISSLFSAINIADIKKIVCDINTIILMNNGDLYGIGLNRYGEFGLGSTGYKTFTKIASDVLDASCTSVACIYIKNDGTVWGSGRNSEYMIKPKTEGGVINENITSFVQMFKTVSTPILQIKISDYTITAYSSFNAYTTGSNSSGCAGDGNATTATTNTTGGMISVTLSAECIRSSALDIIHRTQNGISMYIGANNKIYSTGYNYNGALCLGISTQIIATFTEVPGITVNPTDVLSFTIYNTYLGRNEDIYGAGANGNTPMSTDTYTNALLQLQDVRWKK